MYMYTLHDYSKFMLLLIIYVNCTCITLHTIYSKDSKKKDNMDPGPIIIIIIIIRLLMDMKDSKKKDNMDPGPCPLII